MSARVLIIPGILAVFSVTVIWAALQLELSPDIIVGDSMQPRAFPVFLMAINLVLVLILAIQLVRAPPKKVTLEPFATWGSMILLVVFFALTVWLDMFIAIPVVMFLMCLLWGERRIYVAISTALLTPFLIFLLFDLVLKVRFPRGILMNWYYG
jgi:putative tricarboxylic transport membrane protein